MNDMIKRFGSSMDPETVEYVALGRFTRPLSLSQLNRTKESLEIYDGLARQLRESPWPN